MLKVVTTRNKIDYCQSKLEAELKGALPNNERLRIGHPGGNFENLIYYDKSLWFSTKKLTGEDGEIPRYWNGFGLGKREGGHQTIIVEVNPPTEGVFRRVSGLFAWDERTGRYYVLHRGRVGGGRKGIGKDSFKAWYRGSWVEVYEPNGDVDEAILIGPLGVSGLVTPLLTFVREVAKFKDEVVSGRLGRKPPETADGRTFSAELFGRRKGTRISTIEYESYHGLVVNELEAWLKMRGIARNRRVYNTKFIDLGVVANGRESHLFEVKSAADLQSVYTGIGQLFLHSKGDRKVRKTLVLPHGECPQGIKKALDKLGINLLEYSIRGDTVKFWT